jgi:hypothetical protein
VSGLSTLKSVLMRSRACLPNSRAGQQHRPILLRQLGFELASLG